MNQKPTTKGEKMKEWQVKTGTGKLPCILRNGCFVAGMGEHRLALKDANDLVTAANQHTALLAVAEAAKNVDRLFSRPWTSGENEERLSALKTQRAALATLAQIQKGE